MSIYLSKVLVVSIDLRYQISEISKIPTAAFPTIRSVITEIIMREILMVLRYIIECAQTYYTECDPLNMFYVAVPPEIYGLVVGPGRHHPGSPIHPDNIPKYTRIEDTIARETVKDT